MGKTYSKEETIIAQSAAGDGKNGASAETSYATVSTTNILLTIIVVVLLAAAGYAFCRYYKKMHNEWMERQMNRRSLRRREASSYFTKATSPREEQV